MTGREPNHELDDELLSAYLDGELSSADRAAVEARLATDQAAQQLLHELRSVSQSVQALPLEKLGRDLSDEVVRRAQAAKPTPLKTEPARSGGPLPKLPIFGSTRSWIWASLALAAGLLIMVFYPGDQQKNGLPDLAQRDDQPAARMPVEESKSRARREAAAPAASESTDTVAFAPVNQPTDKPASGAGAMPAKPVDGLRGSSEPAAGEATSLATGTPAPKNDHLDTKLDDGSGTAKKLAAPEATDKLAKSPQAAGGAWGTDRQDAAFGGGKLELAAGAQPLVVVHVVAKREALDKKSFEQLLVNNGIAVETDRAKAGTAGDVYRYTRQFQKEKQAQQLGAQANQKRPLDVVLVEAPAPTITRCVASLNKDSDNYTNIEVSEAASPNAWFDAKAVPNKKVAEDLTKYNRGAVPQQQKDSLQQGDFATYFDVESLRERVADESSRESESNTVSGVRQEVNGTLGEAAKHKSSDNGRAWRIQTRFDEGQLEDRSSIRSGERGALTGNAEQKQKSLGSERKLKEIKKLNGDKLYVLFVLSPQETPASAAPAAAAASSPQPAVPTK